MQKSKINGIKDTCILFKCKQINREKHLQKYNLNNAYKGMCFWKLSYYDLGMLICLLQQLFVATTASFC